jgi:peptidoglycan/LPS O-acetylase OafA/YrhL
MKKPRNYLSDFVGVDLLRFFLSMSVLFPHYANFYYQFSWNIGPGLKQQPFFKFLWPLYEEGGLAVQYFWLISGLIFQAVYFKEISNRQITFKRFATLRLSRLYPLHFATLLIVALLQFAFFTVTGRYFLDEVNTLSNFVMQIFFIANWFPDRNYSFNVPIWSVSIEVLVYILFYLITLAGLTKGRSLYYIIVVSVFLRFFGILDPFHECLLYFFSGCLLVQFINEGIPMQRLVFRYGVASALLAIPAFFRYHYYANGYAFVEGFEFRLLLVPIASLTVLSFILAFRNLKSKRVIGHIRLLGNMTYSMYLVHFPIQIIILMCLKPASYQTFNSPMMLLFFIASVMVTGWVVFEYFEKPAQKYLRKWFITEEESKQPEQELQPPTNALETA